MNASIGCQNPRLLSYRNGSNSKLVIQLDEPKLWDKGWNHTFTSVQAGPWVSLLRVCVYTNRRGHSSGSWEAEDMTRYHVGSTSMKVARPNGNGSRLVPIRSTYRCHRLSRKTCLPASGGVTTSNVSLGWVR